jgi:hypothetical protein
VPYTARATSLTGGCPFPEDPTLDARDARPAWHRRHGRWTRLVPDDDPAAAPFDLWAIPGAKSMTADGADLRLHVRAGGQLVGLVLSEALCDGDRFACVVPVGTKVQSARAVLDLAFGLLRRPRIGTRTSVSRPSRSAIVHARALQALDGALAGASQREIAIAVFGEAHVAANWTADSELRAQVRYLIQRGRALMQGQYRPLLD